jgi:hypothetical protein
MGMHNKSGNGEGGRVALRTHPTYNLLNTQIIIYYNFRTKTLNKLVNIAPNSATELLSV